MGVRFHAFFIGKISAGSFQQSAQAVQHFAREIRTPIVGYPHSTPPMAMKSFFLFVSALGLAGCSLFADSDSSPRTPDPLILNAETSGLIAQSNHFGVDLFREVAADETENLMLSPLSASVALTMLLNGTSGETFTQIRDLLGYSPTADLASINESYRSLTQQLLNVDREVTLTLANAMFYREGFGVKTPYLNTLRTAFDAEISGLNFNAPSAVTTINSWASSKTNGRIPQVIDRITQETVLFLMNALYFKGEWTTPFEEAKTASRPFALENDTYVNVPTMEGRVDSRQFSTGTYRAIELPYGRRNFSMVVLVPNESLNTFLPRFTPALWDEISSGLGQEDTWTSTLVRLPRFSFSYERTLNTVLQRLGMTDAFSAARADLSRISDERLYVSFVKQNTFVEVNEEGTEAAAVTTIGIEVTSLPMGFFVDKPFLFLIRERTSNTLLFVGQVVNPAL